MMKYLLFTLFLLYPSIFWGQKIFINEFQSENYKTLILQDNKTPDWIEIYNDESTPINLNNWMLSDESNEPAKFIFPNISIPAKGFLIVYASGIQNTSLLHTSFKISDDKDSLFLYNPDTSLIDQFNALCIPEDKTFGRKTDGSNTLVHFSTPSPGKSNNGNSTTSITRITDELSFSVKGGFYEQPQTVNITSSDSRATIYYTLDGDEPHTRESKLSGSILIKNRRKDKDKLADIPTAEDWIEPDGKVFKGTTLRARSFYQGCPSSKDVVHSYFINEAMKERYNVPVFSLTTEKDNFFDFNTGIYVPGVNQKSNDLRGTGNSFQSGKAWERPVHVEMFSRNGALQFSQHAGVRVHGNTTRSYPQKTLRLYARKEYSNDSTFNFKFFENKTADHFQTILLRTANADISNTFFKDGLCHNLVQKMNIDYQAFSPAIVFLNGEYWGIHNIRERQDEYYLKRQHNVDPGTYDLISISEKVSGFLEVVEGNLKEYNQMLEFIRSHDLSQRENYDSISSKIDIPNFIDYHIAQLFLANEDWPNANTKFWKPNQQGAKWKWLFFDCDRCFSDVDMDKINQFTGNRIENSLPDWATEVQRALFKSSIFRKQFFARFTYAMNHFFRPSQLIREIERLENIYQGLANEHIDRWQLPNSYFAWKDNVDALKTFALYRPIEMLDQLQKNFASPFTIYPNPTLADYKISSELPTGEQIQAEMYDQMGKTIKKWNLNTQDFSVNTNGLRPGVYYIRLIYGELIFNHQLILTR